MVLGTKPVLVTIAETVQHLEYKLDSYLYPPFVVAVAAPAAFVVAVVAVAEVDADAWKECCTRGKKKRERLPELFCL